MRILRQASLGEGQIVTPRFQGMLSDPFGQDFFPDGEGDSVRHAKRHRFVSAHVIVTITEAFLDLFLGNEAQRETKERDRERLPHAVYLRATMSVWCIKVCIV